MEYVRAVGPPLVEGPEEEAARRADEAADVFGACFKNCAASNDEEARHGRREVDQAFLKLIKRFAWRAVMWRKVILDIDLRRSRRHRRDGFFLPPSRQLHHVDSQTQISSIGSVPRASP